MIVTVVEGTMGEIITRSSASVMVTVKSWSFSKLPSLSMGMLMGVKSPGVSPSAGIVPAGMKKSARTDAS